jgi:threonine aldolase
MGAMICGSAAFIRAALRNRKAVGGAMRQGGVMAAAGIVALEQMVDRLAEDHENARVLAEGLANVPGLAVNLAMVQTNIVMVDIVAPSLSAVDVSAALRAEGLKINPNRDRRLRAVTHYGIERRDIDHSLTVVRRVMKQIG